MDFPSFSEGLSLRGHGVYPAQERFYDFPSFSEGLSLRAAHSGLCGQHLNLPYGFVGTFPNPTLLRSWARHSPGTELFLFAEHKQLG